MSEFDGSGSAEQRARFDDEVHSRCARCRLPGHSEPLSDAAAVAIAAGRVDEATRAVLINRWYAGRLLPSIGGFGALRNLVDERDRWLAKDTTSKPGSALVNKLRAAELSKRVNHHRTTVVMSNRHYATGVRAARKERREGVHLDLDQRDAIFDALTRTPAPEKFGPIAERGLSLVDAATDRVSTLARKTPVADRVEWATGLVDQFVDRKDDRFVDRYDTLLFLAGTSFDRVRRSPAWQSTYFEIQRNQLDLFVELTEIAVDAASLRTVATELNRIGETMVDEETAAQVESRRGALEVVWKQLTGRVAALVRLANVVESSETEARTSDAMARAHSLDDRIDDLVGRSGSREMSAENTHFVGDQVRTQWRD
ncbi:hypothetical protein O4160_15040 [Rhodococcus sp. IEGM 1401]|uniref:hypothetical protein n=1 Tax=unclassified Rhodococcus (in: high G+C Gram-positive bacteria) TaxID=192944 RepID=UPI0022B36A78|nr:MULTISPECIES: hypothetical protein [unclassified Rhodococcus (in: high G+C Gram-positive bacteria)]MCZ4562155.1 hypothetical protein [Rhodococcus sp. IEGM 1401]MDI9922129.1 hypothetical protein [Rhodococcus sp. IEGM 1372]MDV8034682.1 hypothetical protein [Rhodococcus sp. IEGM 1414]